MITSEWTNVGAPRYEEHLVMRTVCVAIGPMGQASYQEMTDINDDVIRATTHLGGRNDTAIGAGGTD